jgi:hypothetical protein
LGGDLARDVAPTILSRMRADSADAAKAARSS